MAVCKLKTSWVCKLHKSSLLWEILLEKTRRNLSMAMAMGHGNYNNCGHATGCQYRNISSSSRRRDGHLVDLHDVLERGAGRDLDVFLPEVGAVVAEREARRDDHPPLAAGPHGAQHVLDALAHAPGVRPGAHHQRQRPLAVAERVHERLPAGHPALQVDHHQVARPRDVAAADAHLVVPDPVGQDDLLLLLHVPAGAHERQRSGHCTHQKSSNGGFVTERINDPRAWREWH